METETIEKMKAELEAQKKKLKRAQIEAEEAVLFGYMVGRTGRHYAQWATGEFQVMDLRIYSKALDPDRVRLMRQKIADLQLQIQKELEEEENDRAHI